METVTNEVTDLLKEWEEQHPTSSYDPIPTLTRLAEIIESETENFMKKDPDPFDERHPSRTDPECALGHALKIMFKKDNFMTKLVNDYVRDNYYTRLNIANRDVRKLNIAACRLTLDLMPGLEMSVVFQDNEALIHRLAGWASNSVEPLQSYATGLLAAAMEVQEIAANFREVNAWLVPLMLKRLHELQRKTMEKQTTPTTQKRHFAQIGNSKSSERLAALQSTPKKNESTSADVELEASPRHSERLMSPPLRPPPPASTPVAAIPDNSNSSWAEMETYVIGTLNCRSYLALSHLFREVYKSKKYDHTQQGNIQIHPPTDATRQMLILRYLTPMGEYQEFLCNVFENNALGLILNYINVRESKDSRLAFEALKYLAALLCHKKFSIDFIHMGGLQRFLEVPRPSVAATGVSICLYYLAYCEDAMERVCLLPRKTLQDLVKYALWLLECSHDSGRCHATMFFGLSFQFRVILDEFDSQDGLRKLYNVISTLPILGTEDDEAAVSEDEMCAARQIVRHVAVALRRYLEAHLRRRAIEFGGEVVPDQNICKASKSTPEEVQAQIEMLQNMPYARWAPVEQLLKLGGVSLMLRVVAHAYDWNFNGRAETVRSALDVVGICCVAPKVQLLLCERLEMPDDDLPVGVNVVLAAAEGEIVAEAEVQKSALNVLVNCVCAPLHRHPGASSSKATLTSSAKKRQAAKSYEDVIDKVWESVRTNNGIMVLLQLMLVKSPITDADRIRGLACRALAGLARCSTVRQIISKLPLFTTGQIQGLMRDPILQEKRQEHVMFQKYALELLERISGKSKHMGNELETSLVNIHRANVVAQTQINYNERELMQLIHSHLVSRGLSETATCLLREANLPPAPAHPPQAPPPHVYTPPARTRLSTSRTGSLNSSFREVEQSVPGSVSHTPNGYSTHNGVTDDITPHHNQAPLIKIRRPTHQPSSISSSPASEWRRPQPKTTTTSQPVQHRPTLHSIITEYLYNQHALCKNPMATCPQFNLFVPHKCPDGRAVARWSTNVCARVWARSIGWNTSRRLDVQLAHTNFCPVRTFRSSGDNGCFTYCAYHPTQPQLLAATSQGDIKVFNLFTGAEEASHQVHDSYICHMQPSRDGKLLLCSSSTTWRPISALWSLTSFEQRYPFDEEEYVEFSKTTDDKIIGTKGETATVYDTKTGKQIITLSPTISNQYTKNRSTFNPSDELVLSDGVLWDVNSGKEIHKFDKLNQLLSGVFHPNGLEIISNTEVWDLRTFHLLRTVPTLDRSEVIFNPECTVLYSVCMDQDSEDQSQYESSFKTLDAYDYSSIATIEVKRNIYGLSVDKTGLQIALVENLGETDSVEESVIKLYDVGRKRDMDDEAEEDEEEDMGDNSEGDNSDSGSDNDDLASDLLRNAVLGMDDGSSRSSSVAEWENELPVRRLRRRLLRRNRRNRPEEENNGDSDSSGDNLSELELD